MAIKRTASSGAMPGGNVSLALRGRRHPLVSELSRRLAVECGVPTGARVVVAVSGGADSCALLVACAALAARRKRDGLALLVHAVHVHHHLRADADADAECAAELASRLGVPMRVEHVHPALERGSRGASARRLRYAELLRVAKEIGASFVLTAHHAEDQLETMLMAIGRGAGLRSLRAMAWRRKLGDDVALARPLLLARKADCESLCVAAGVSWREDMSNRDRRNKRARLRADVLPILDELWPGVARRCVSTTELLGEASKLLEREVALIFGEASAQQWPRAELASHSNELLREGLRRAVESMHGGPLQSLTQHHLRSVATHIRSLDPRPRRFEWPGGMVVRVTKKLVSITRA